MLTVFGNRAGGRRVTTLGTLINAVIISTFLHFSIPGWGSFQLAYAEQLTITSQTSVISSPCQAPAFWSGCYESFCVS